MNNTVSTTENYLNPSITNETREGYYVRNHSVKQVYHLAIIDYLQNWNALKVIERWTKSKFRSG
jgi:hypothetical protein